MKISSFLGYIGIFIGILLGLDNMLNIIGLISPTASLAFLGSFIFSLSGLIAIKLSSEDTNMAALLFLISGIGILITLSQDGIITFILFMIASFLEFKNKTKINNFTQRKKIIILQVIIILLIPILYFIKSLFIIYPV